MSRAKHQQLNIVDRPLTKNKAEASVTASVRQLSRPEKNICLAWANTRRCPP